MTEQLPATVLELLNKVKALAEQGVGGEASNAQLMLEKLLAKYDLTLDALDLVHRSTRTFTWRMQHDKKILFQCMWKCCTEWDGSYRDKGSYIYVEMTDAEYIDVKELYSYYMAAFRKEMDALYLAFVHKHELFSNKPKESTGPGMSAEEWAAIRALMKGLTVPTKLAKSHQIEHKN